MDKLQYKIYHENKTHTPDDFPYNTYLCSIPLDFKSVNLHWHDEVEIIVIKKGTGIVSVDHLFCQRRRHYFCPPRTAPRNQPERQGDYGIREYSIQIQPFKIIWLRLMQR